MRRAWIVAIVSLGILWTLAQLAVRDDAGTDAGRTGTAGGSSGVRQISGIVKAGETMSHIFEKYGLDVADLLRMREAAADVYRLKRIAKGQPYRIALDADNSVLSLDYVIDDEQILTVVRDEDGFRARKDAIAYERRTGTVAGVIETNLVAALEGTGDSALLAIRLSDILSWDLDFNTDLRRGDSFGIVVEELWRDGRFHHYGDILAAEFTNDGTTYRAYRYEAGGRPAYFDEDGKSLQRAFLKAPLSYRRISSGFSRSRLHPILKIRRPHFGVDYAAPRGTPVSALGDGTVRFAGRRGPNGNLAIVSHPRGYTTYYGHLSRFGRGIRKGARVAQGDVIGYVGATGRATGPHLDFRIRKGGRFLNPAAVDLPRGTGVPEDRLADFGHFRSGMDAALASAAASRYARVSPPAGDDRGR
ncbi:MAG: peptidoglycan DD-metalloendopeptidase family protein [Gemmatimonadota bacterium]